MSRISDYKIEVSNPELVTREDLDVERLNKELAERLLEIGKPKILVGTYVWSKFAWNVKFKYDDPKSGVIEIEYFILPMDTPY